MNCVKDNNNNNIYANQQSDVKIIMDGCNNILWIDDGVKFDKDSLIHFKGNNSMVYFGRNKNIIKINLSINNNCTFSFGRNNYINGKMNVVISEETNVIIGDDCLFSFGIWIRTADPHLIYDCTSHSRLNYSKDIIIGDHVWIGQNTLILKGTQVGSGSIIGACSVVSNKIIHSNACFAGNPVRNVKNNIYWNDSCVHAWTFKETKKYEKNSSKEWIYSPDSSKIVLKDLNDFKYNIKKRKEIILQMYDNKKYNRERFSILREHKCFINCNKYTKLKYKFKLLIKKFLK